MSLRFSPAHWPRKKVVRADREKGALPFISLLKSVTKSNRGGFRGNEGGHILVGVAGRGARSFAALQRGDAPRGMTGDCGSRVSALRSVLHRAAPAPRFAAALHAAGAPQERSALVHSRPHRLHDLGPFDPVAMHRLLELRERLVARRIAELGHLPLRLRIAERHLERKVELER